jgi:hypothetical protein
MQKLDRLGWAAGLSVSAYGVRLGVRTNDPSVLARVWPLLPPGARHSRHRRVDRLFSVTVGRTEPRRNVRQFHLVYSDARRLARTLELGEALSALASDLQLSVAELAPRRVFVHAGVVGWRGGAILLPGSSHAGKSTLVTALVRAGATYYSDEYAVLDLSGRVHAYARDPQLRGADGVPVPVPLHRLGGRPGHRALPVALVALVRYREGARWRPRRLSPGQGALEVLAHTVPARVRPDAALAALREVVGRAAVWKGVRGETDRLVPWLLEAAEGAGGRT